jgi:hypothetical protein
MKAAKINASIIIGRELATIGWRLIKKAAKTPKKKSFPYVFVFHDIIFQDNE